MIYFLIPTYNDAENLKDLMNNIFRVLKNEKYKVLLVDDGSTDKTSIEIQKLSKSFPVQKIGYKTNKGPGSAFKYGFKYLNPYLKDKDIVITMEADNTADYRIITEMLNKLDKYDIVLASPLSPNGKLIGLDQTRKFLSQVASRVDKLLFRIDGVNTYSSFFRAHRASIVKKLIYKYKENFITENGFTSILEMLIKFSKINSTIIEIPATIDWNKRKGKSKMKIMKTINRHMQVYKNYLTGKYDL